MSGSMSRRKGARGELEACELLGHVMGFQWARTAQRWGNAKADIEPVPPRSSILHVEVKRYVGGLKWWTTRVRKHPDAVHLDDRDGIYFARAEGMHNAVRQHLPIELAPRQGCVTKWMAQAVRDAAPGMLPVVLCRQDQGMWILAWRYQDDDRHMAYWREVLDEAGTL